VVSLELREGIHSMFGVEAAKNGLEDAQGWVFWSRADGRMPSTLDRRRGTSDRLALDAESQRCSRSSLRGCDSDPEAVARGPRQGNGWR
jgi:hypothetical protein